MEKEVQQTVSRERPASSVSERQGKTWHSLGEIYGARWTRDNGDAPGRVWGSMINALTDNELATALANLVKNPRKDGRGNIHPPSAPEFYEAAKVGAARAHTMIEDHSRDFSHYGRVANFRLFLIIMREKGVPDIAAMVKEKDRLVADFDMMRADGMDTEWESFTETIDKRLELILAESKKR